MNFPSLSGYAQQLVAPLREQLRPGSVVLCDQFKKGGHGHLVAQVAAQSSSRPIPIIAIPFEDERDPDYRVGQQRLAEQVENWGTAEQPEVVRQSLYECMLLTRLKAVELATQRLVTLHEAAAQQVVLNFSLGSNAAMCVAAVLAMGQDPRAIQQWAKAFGVEPGQLKAEQPQAWKSVHSGLVELANRSSRDERLVEAQQKFRSAVRQFEDAGNSLVIAAGNDGQFPSQLKCEVPADFTCSDLITPEVTVVGALENGQAAAYTSHPASVTAWAPGAIQLGNELVRGTSFAAPQVSVALAQLHGQHPEWSSAQVEQALN